MTTKLAAVRPSLSSHLTVPSALVVLAILYLCWPARESWILSGIPLRTPAIAALGAVVWCAVWGRRPPGPRGWIWVGAAAALLIGRLVAAAWTLPAGWQASYFPSPDLTGTVEPSTEWRATDWTRVDRRIDFRGNAFPLHFINELRYNGHPAKHMPPFSARWQGQFLANAGEREVVIAIEWLNRAAVSIDGRSVLDEQAPTRTIARRDVRVPIEPGPHAIEVRYFNPAGEPSRMRLDVVSPVVATTTPLTDARVRLSSIARVVLLVFDAVVIAGILGWFAAGVARAPGEGKWALVVCLLPAVISMRWDGLPSAMFSVPTGFDCLTYEDYARAAILHGPAIDWGHLAHKAYEYTVGYHYFLSLVHVFFGESVYEILQANETLFFVTLVLNVIMAKRLGGNAAAFVCLAFGLYCYAAMFWLTTYIYKENLIILLNALLAFVLSQPGPATARRAALVGIVAGLDCLADPANIILLPVVIGLVAWRAMPADRMRHAAIATAITIACLLVVPLRNLAVAGTFDMLPTEGRSALWVGNPPPPGLFVGAINDRYLETVIGYLRTEPLHFFQGWLQKGLYAIGLYFVRNETSGMAEIFSPVMLLAWMAFFVAIGRVRSLPSWALMLIAVGLARGAIMVVFVSYMHGDRYELPWLIAVSPLLATTIVGFWQFSCVAVLLVAIVIAGWDYYRVFPSLAYVPFSEHRQLYSSSYGVLRRSLRKPGAAEAPWQWTFPAAQGVWQPHQDSTAVALQTGTFYQAPAGSVTSILPGPLGQPALLVKTVRVRAAFDGWAHFAQLRWRRAGEPKEYFANVPIDQTGRVRDYDVPVSRTSDWTGEIEDLRILYWGEQFTLERVELVPYDVR